jgi:hypothetical protein
MTKLTLVKWKVVIRLTFLALNYFYFPTFCTNCPEISCSWLHHALLDEHSEEDAPWSRQCHGSGGQSSATHHEKKVVWDFSTKINWETFFSEYFGFSHERHPASDPYHFFHTLSRHSIILASEAGTFRKPLADKIFAEDATIRNAYYVATLHSPLTDFSQSCVFWCD